MGITPDFFVNLKSIAQQDLSKAHVHQHRAGAAAVALAAGVSVDGPGAYSVWKPSDTLIYENGYVSGKKYWISDAPNVKWAVLNAKHQTQDVMVLVEIDPAHVELVSVQGMEMTHTAHANFDQIPAHYIYNKMLIPEKFFESLKIISLGFFTNHLGLAEALFQDIDNFTNDVGMSCNYNKDQIKLELEILNILWKNKISELHLDHKVNHDHWKDHAILYAYAKKVLLDTTKLTLEFTGSGLYQAGAPAHQRYQDALIYCSHMKNFYLALGAIPK
jgi:hypothetical protein